MSDSPRAILLDIEGTTSAIDFVYKVLMPHARESFDAYLKSHWNDAAIIDIRRQLDANADRETILKTLYDLSDRDVKSTPLKALQGLIWQQGYADGELKSHVYPDVVPALDRWKSRGVDIRIYSSGSIVAQKAFFSTTDFGNLLPYFSGHYDTTIGSKRESGSYAKIAEDWNLAPAEILFVSDIAAELDAASAAGFQTRLIARGEMPRDYTHPLIRRFDQLP